MKRWFLWRAALITVLAIAVWWPRAEAIGPLVIAILFEVVGWCIVALRPHPEIAIGALIGALLSSLFGS
jgi:uncharacterized membrane protein YraQ (UPF0718 family)